MMGKSYLPFLNIPLTKVLLKLPWQGNSSETDTKENPLLLLDFLFYLFSYPSHDFGEMGSDF